MTHAATRTALGIVAAVLACCAVLAVDPPDLRLNAVSGLIETVDATWSGANYNVRYTVVDGAGQQSGTVLLTTNRANDLDPRIILSSVGDACVAWWRDTSPNQIVYRKHYLATGTWGGETVVGYSVESNSRPRLTYAGDKLWAAYLISASKTRSVGAEIIDDDPEPVRSIVATTSYTGDLDIQISYESGHLWLTWIDAASKVGWSEYVYAKAQWSVPSYESYSTDGVSAARERIGRRILGS